MKNKKTFEEYNCDLKNEAACEEELEEEGLNFEEIEGDEFGE